jgi:hypothetical protein
VRRDRRDGDREDPGPRRGTGRRRRRVGPEGQDRLAARGGEQVPGIAVAGCGAIKGAWFKPSAAPIDCLYAIGAGATATCTVAGATAGATFAATSQEVLLAMHTTTIPQCGPVTAAITLADGRVASTRDDWC